MSDSDLPEKFDEARAYRTLTWALGQLDPGERKEWIRNLIGGMERDEGTWHQAMPWGRPWEPREEFVEKAAQDPGLLASALLDLLTLAAPSRLLNSTFAGNPSVEEMTSHNPDDPTFVLPDYLSHVLEQVTSPGDPAFPPILDLRNPSSERNP